MMISSIILEKIKKQNNIQTYSEILAYLEGEKNHPEKAYAGKKGAWLNKPIIVVIIGIVTLVLGFISYAVFF